MKIERKSNSQIRKDKESLVMENFKSVMKKLDATFLIESDKVCGECGGEIEHLQARRDKTDFISKCTECGATESDVEDESTSKEKNEVKEDMPVDYVKDPKGNMVGTKRHGAGFVPSEKGVEQGYKSDKDAPNDAEVGNKDLKRDVSSFLDKLNIQSVETIIDRIDTPAEQAEVMTQFAVRLGIDPNKLPFIFSQIKGKVKN